MDERVVRTRVPIGGGRYRHGSGYLVSSGRVLTARHVLAAEGARPSVGQSCEVLLCPWDPAQGWVPGRVTWLHRTEDAAVLDVQGAGAHLPALRWGRVEGTDPLDWTATGFPVAGRDPDGRRVEETAFGPVAPETGASVGGLAMTVRSREARSDPDGGSGWAGLSGAAVLSRGLVIGLVVSDPKRWGNSLEGIRSVWLLEDPDLAAASGTVAETIPVSAGGRPPTAPSVPRFVGEHVSTAIQHWQNRDQIREELEAALLRPATEKRILSVIGRRGVGKSATVDKVVTELERPDPARAPLDDLDGVVSLSTRTGVGSLTLARIVEELTRLVPEPLSGRLRADWERLGRGALPSLWEALRDGRYVLVLDNLDDLQDATGALRDPELVALLDSVCRTASPPRVLTTSQRSLDLPPDLAPFVDEFSLDVGLGDTHAVLLLRSIYRGRGLEKFDDATLARATGRLFGIPRGIELLADRLRRNPLTVRQVLASEATPEALLKQLVSDAFQDLDALPRHVVELLALAGVPLPASDVPELLDGVADAETVADALQSLVLSREVGFEEAAETVRLHPLDADWVRGHLLENDPGMQVDLDRRLARWYEAQRTPPDTWRSLADAAPSRLEYRHLWRAGDHDGALEVLAEAANFLARKGESAALRSAVAAAEPVVGNDVGRMHLELCTYAVEFFSGSLAEAERAVRAARTAAAAAGRPAVVDELDVNLGLVQRHRENCSGAVETFRALLARDPEHLAHPLRLQALFELGLTLCYLRDWAGAEAAAAELADQLLPDDPHYLQAAPSDVRALAGLGSGDFDGALAAADQAIDHYRNSPRVDNAGYLYNVRGLVWLARGRLDRAEEELRRGINLAADFRIDRLEGICSTNLAWTLLRAGRWDDARAAGEAGAARLASAGLDAAETSRVLAKLASRDADTPVDESLREAVARSSSNSDFYTPPDDVLREIAASLATASAAPVAPVP